MFSLPTIWLRLLACTAVSATLVGCSLPRIRPAKPGDHNSIEVVSTEEGRGRFSRRTPSIHEATETCLAAAREFEAHNELPAAIEQYERARSFDSQLKGVAKRLAVLYEREGNRDKAVVEYAAAFREEPRDADLWNDFSHFQFAGGDYVTAEAAARTALRINSEHKLAWVNLGLSLAEQRKYDEARESLARAVGPDAAGQNLKIILARHEQTLTTQPTGDGVRQ